MDKIVFIVVSFSTFLGFLAIFATMAALPVMWLWNYVCPDLLHLPTIDFWHSWALLFLGGFLGKSGPFK
jgi:hypothetical protein